MNKKKLGSLVGVIGTCGLLTAVGLGVFGDGDNGHYASAQYASEFSQQVKQNLSSETAIASEPVEVDFAGQETPKEAAQLEAKEVLADEGAALPAAAEKETSEAAIEPVTRSTEERALPDSEVKEAPEKKQEPSALPKKADAEAKAKEETKAKAKAEAEAKAKEEAKAKAKAEAEAKAKEEAKAKAKAEAEAKAKEEAKAKAKAEAEAKAKEEAKAKAKAEAEAKAKEEAKAKAKAEAEAKAKAEAEAKAKAEAEAKAKAEAEAKEKEKKAATPQGPVLKYTLKQLRFHGVIKWNGYKFTFYSQKVLPGGGLRIPGRHVNEAGYVADKDGFIVLANNAPMGTVIPTPFGYWGKVYDRGTYGNHFDVYVK